MGLRSFTLGSLMYRTLVIVAASASTRDGWTRSPVNVLALK
jgi:hypothetical protein